MTSLQQFKKTNKSLKRTFAFLSAALLFSPRFLSALEVPAESGKVYEQFTGSNGKTLVLIQEAHVDYGAQKAVAEILRGLIEKESLRLILVEGGWGDVGLASLRSLGSREGRAKVAEQYLREGKISAEEYLDLTSDFSLTLWGIEDPAAYRENMEAFLKLHEVRPKLLEILTQTESLLRKVQEKTFSLPALTLEKKRRAYRDRKINLFEYLQFLSSLKKNEKSSDLDLGRFPHLQKLTALTGIGPRDGGLDAGKAEWEKQNLIRFLSKKLTKLEFEKLRLLEERKTPEEELKFLKSLTSLYEKTSSQGKAVPYENLKVYLRVFEEVVASNPKAVFEEVDALEGEMRQALLAGEVMQTTARMGDSLEILKQLFELKLSPAEFERLETDSADFDLSHWEDFLKIKLAQLGISSNPLPDFQEIQKWTPEAKKFYGAARKREQALIENAVTKIESEGEKIAALICGGFHAERLAAAFKEKGYSLFVVSPRFTPADPKMQEQLYFNLLKTKWGTGPNVPAPSQSLSQGG